MTKAFGKITEPQESVCGGSSTHPGGLRLILVFSFLKPLLMEPRVGRPPNRATIHDRPQPHSGPLKSCSRIDLLLLICCCRFADVEEGFWDVFLPPRGTKKPIPRLMIGRGRVLFKRLGVLKQQVPMRSCGERSKILRCQPRGAKRLQPERAREPLRCLLRWW